MGRRKSKPHRSGGIILETNATAEAELDKQNAVEAGEEAKNDFGDIDIPYFVEVDRSGWLSGEHLDISEVVLRDLNLREGFSGFELSEDFYRDPQYSLRFQVYNVGNVLGRIKLGHWPVLPYTDIHLEFVKRATVDNTETCTVLFSGIFDGPDEGVSGLVHLASLKFVTLRAVLGTRLSEDIPSLRVRVEVLKSAFDACESLLEGSRQLWKKSTMNVMSWLRPEIMTSEVRYGFGSYMKMEIDPQTEMGDGSGNARKHARFDPAGFYEAIKPSKTEPMLEDDIPDLLPELRPYQRRAAFWMVKREKAMEESQGERERNQFHSPLCVPVDFLDTSSKMFFNPFSGNISLCPETSSPYVFGGILADEMGLGKTVELLACIFAHRRSAYGSNILIDLVPQVNGDQKVTLKRLKRERVECICGAVSESLKYQGLWVQCDICDAWQHADCVGYSPKGKSLKSKQGCESKTYKTTIFERDGEYVCQMCSELIQATESPIASGATLIVCPAPILPQWHDEIIRHTSPGSLKTCVYEGVRDTSLSNTSLMDINDLASADIVLTTYDVLKEDLSHDSDRHKGDRHLLRFQKRYPVIPTLLTRIYWWRVCLDEAQMVESSATAATEMALRLHSKHRWCITGTPIQRKLDDLYGLLKFLKASPFNTYRWWTEVIRDPYEKGDMGAMEFMHRIFKQIMWRSSKEHVADELDLPSQEECLSWLTLSPVEEHFYQRQHETCVRDAHEVIENLRNDILNRKVPDSVSLNGSSDPLITHMEAGKLLNALLKLRQACCHPQVGSSGLRSLQQSPMTMEEILMVLISKTKIEGEEALRRLVVALNGLAAIATIQNDFSLAAILYNEALTFAEEHSEDFRVDPLLNIHIHHNLAEILPLAANVALILPSKRKQFSGTSAVKATRKHLIVKVDHGPVKRHKTNGRNDINLTVASEEPSNDASNLSEDDLDDQEFANLSASSIKALIAECEDSKQKYLSLFSSKLSAAQLEFQNSYMQANSEVLLEGTLGSDGLYRFENCFNKFTATQPTGDILATSQWQPTVNSATAVCNTYTAPTNTTHTTLPHTPLNSAPTLGPNSYTLWHYRLGHPHYEALKTVLSICRVPLPNKSNMEFCSACCMGKVHRLPSHTCVTLYSSPFALVFCDLWGPAPMLSSCDYKYLLTCVDACTKYTWTFPLKLKSETCSVFKHFKNMVEVQFDTKIKSVQTDGGGEFRALASYFTECGINHRLACPHTHHQNGSVERKHRHIVETGLSLLAQAGLPFQFWDHAFQTATYLINRMPTAVLNMQSPYYALYKQVPDYRFLKVFGCVCYPHIRPYNTHKLDFHTKECVFLGYSSSHKGYKCLAPDGRIFISKDVIFNESKFPYLSLFPKKDHLSNSFNPNHSSVSNPLYVIPLTKVHNHTPSGTVPAHNNVAESATCTSSSAANSAHTSPRASSPCYSAQSESVHSAQSQSVRTATCSSNPASSSSKSAPTDSASAPADSASHYADLRANSLQDVPSFA